MSYNEIWLQAFSASSISAPLLSGQHWYLLSPFCLVLLGQVRRGRVGLYHGGPSMVISLALCFVIAAFPCSPIPVCLRLHSLVWWEKYRGRQFPFWNEDRFLNEIFDSESITRAHSPDDSNDADNSLAFFSPLPSSRLHWNERWDCLWDRYRWSKLEMSEDELCDAYYWLNWKIVI